MASSASLIDVDAERARLTELGYGPRKLVDFKNGETHIARFFFIADPDGYQIEVIQQGARLVSRQHSLDPTSASVMAVHLANAALTAARR